MRGVRVLGRSLSPAALVLALLCFFLPFIAVSCDTPGGYGKLSQGGTTSYTGADLATGGAPQVTSEQLRPADEQRDDRLGWQPVAVLAGLLALGGLAVNLGLRRRRGEATATAAVAAAVALIAAELIARRELVYRVAEQAGLSRSEAADHVQTQRGFWLCLSLLLLAAGAALFEPVRRRPQGSAAPAAPG